MEWSLTSLAETFAVAITALGGLEFLKWMFTRKSRSRLAQAEALSAEVEAKKDEFHFLKEQLEFTSQQLLEKEQRFQEQTSLVRDLNRQLLEKTMENGTLSAEISALKAERAMKLCERRGCNTRIPQSGY